MWSLRDLKIQLEVMGIVSKICWIRLLKLSKNWPRRDFVPFIWAWRKLAIMNIMNGIKNSKKQSWILKIGSKQWRMSTIKLNKICSWSVQQLLKTDFKRMLRIRFNSRKKQGLKCGFWLEIKLERRSTSVFLLAYSIKRKIWLCMWSGRQ